MREWSLSTDARGPAAAGGVSEGVREAASLLPHRERDRRQNCTVAGGAKFLGTPLAFISGAAVTLEDPARSIKAQTPYHRRPMARTAHKIGSLLFCPDCGTLLDLPKPDEDVVICEQCHFQEKASAYENIVIKTRSHPDAFPSALRQKRKTQTKVHESGETRTITRETCPECGYHEAYMTEKQMRSADEGSTIMYTCVSCKHGWRLNN